MDVPAAEQDLQLSHWLRVLRRRWALIATTVFVVVVSAAVYLLVRAPTYEAATDVSIASTDPNSATPTSLDVTSVGQLARSREVEQRAQQQLGQRVAASVASQAETGVITFTVTARTRTLAARGANAYADALIGIRRDAAEAQVASATQRLRGSVATTESQIAELESSGNVAPDDPRLKQLQAQRSAYETALNDLQVRSALSPLQGEQVVSRAVAPADPKGLSPANTVLLAVVVGLLLAVALAGIVEFSDGSVRHIGEAVGDSQVGVTGTIPPAVGGLRSLWQRILARARPRPHEPSDVVLLTAPDHRAAEAYRNLRTLLTSSGVEKPFGVLQVTSALDDDGAAAVAANLAVAFALSGRPTILASADFRHPRRLEEFFGPLEGPGMASVLMGTGTLDAAAQTNETGVAELWVVPPGQLDGPPADALAHVFTQRIFDRLAARDEIVVLLSPPILGASETALLATFADATLLVARSGRTRRAALRRARDLLTQVGGPLVGTVLVDVRSRA
jgi:succinoglycan biosynthesis transport protein ExoP